jgi:chromosome segregation ATPase
MDRSKIIKLLVSENWTNADAIRAIESIDFNTDPDELTIRRTISLQFAGSELIKRQRLQAAQKGLVTKSNDRIKSLQQDIKNRDLQIKQLTEQVKNIQPRNELLVKGGDELDGDTKQLVEKVKNLEASNQSLVKVSEELKQDNKRLKNIVDAIRLQLAQDMKGILKYPDKDLRQAILKLFKSTQG